jgi:hypothetical protein
MLVEISARLGQPTHFLTLTVRVTAGMTPLEARKKLGEKLPLLMRMIARKLGLQHVPYLVVIERTKAGWPHAHVLMRAKYLKNDAISAMWKRLTGWYITKMVRVRGPGEAARYVAKYLGKDPAKFGNCKRYWTTQDWKLQGSDAEAEEWDRQAWSFTRERVEEVLTRLLREGGQLVPGTGRRGERVVLLPGWHARYLGQEPSISHLRDNAVQPRAPPNKGLAA